LAEWILNELGADVPLHFTAFHPDFKLRDRSRTPPESLDRARRIAMEVGLKFVYEGNIYSEAAHTYCPGCGGRLITRSWHDVQEYRLKDGRCLTCGTVIPGVWKNPRGKFPPKTVADSQGVAEKYGLEL
jgi:pyruvate formate lyase activating enzyme